MSSSYRSLGLGVGVPAAAAVGVYYSQALFTKSADVGVGRRQIRERCDDDLIKISRNMMNRLIRQRRSLCDAAPSSRVMASSSLERSDEDEEEKSEADVRSCYDSVGVEESKEMLRAVERRDLEEVRKILKEASEEQIKVYFEAINDQGMNALQLASSARNGHELVELLLKYGANVNVTDAMGRTALHFTAYGGNGHTARLLLLAGADYTKKDKKRGATPVHYAAAFARPDVVRLLILASGKSDDLVNARDRNGRTPLHWAALSSHRKWAIGSTDVPKLLIMNGADCLARDATGSTPAHTAARLDADDFLAFLMHVADDSPKIQKKIVNTLSLTSKSHQRSTELNEAKIDQKPSSLLLQAADNQGYTPLDIAVLRYEASRFRLRFLWRSWPSFTGLDSFDAALLLPRRLSLPSSVRATAYSSKNKAETKTPKKKQPPPPAHDE